MIETMTILAFVSAVALVAFTGRGRGKEKSEMDKARESQEGKAAVEEEKRD